MLLVRIRLIVISGGKKMRGEGGGSRGEVGKFKVVDGEERGVVGRGGKRRGMRRLMRDITRVRKWGGKDRGWQKKKGG